MGHVYSVLSLFGWILLMTLKDRYYFITNYRWGTKGQRSQVIQHRLPIYQVKYSPLGKRSVVGCSQFFQQTNVYEYPLSSCAFNAIWIHSLCPWRVYSKWERIKTAMIDLMIQCEVRWGKVTENFTSRSVGVKKKSHSGIGHDSSKGEIANGQSKLPKILFQVNTRWNFLKGSSVRMESSL